MSALLISFASEDFTHKQKPSINEPKCEAAVGGINITSHKWISILHQQSENK